MKILLIARDPDLAAHTRNEYEGLGYAVSTAESVQLGRRLVFRERPSLIVVQRGIEDITDLFGDRTGLPFRFIGRDPNEA